MGDLRGFTQMAEKLRSEDVIRVLNRHFARMIRVIEKYRGIIVDFFGDSVLVFFDGLDENVAQRAADAVKCAVEMQREVASVSNDNQKDGLPALEMGIGINTGEVIVGNIGSESRAKYGIVGSAVNETDRIQSYAEGGQVIIAEQTYELLAGRIVVGPRLEVRLKGLDASRNLYQVRSIDA
jgi:sigma-B regulation protein RsbU (phosphoserine phosphatase)